MALDVPLIALPAARGRGAGRGQAGEWHQSTATILTRPRPPAHRCANEWRIGLDEWPTEQAGRALRRATRGPAGSSRKLFFSYQPPG